MPSPSRINRQVFAAIAALAASALCHAHDPKATIADLDQRLAKVGAPKVEGQDKAGDKAAPALYFGERKINNDNEIVDAVKAANGGATATVFVKEGDEFIRVSTNVMTSQGQRGVGSVLAHNAAYAAVSQGQSFCGPIDVLGKAFDACYNPIKNASGQTIGASYVGHPR